jgi:hypothetical protein
MTEEGAPDNQLDNQTDLPDVDKMWSDLLDDALDASQRLELLHQVTSDLKAEVTRRPDATALLDMMRVIQAIL